MTEDIEEQGNYKTSKDVVVILTTIGLSLAILIVSILVGV